MVKRFFMTMFLVLGAAACANGGNTIASARANIERSYTLADLSFAAPADIRISESEEFYPFADIVWRGDPRGPRVQQIAAMFETAANRSKAALTGDVPVVARVSLVRFHGVTDRTRYSVGGNYNIVFDLTVLDARTGTVIEPTRRVTANLDAPGGAEAVALEQSGQTQKVRVTDFLTSVLQQELS